jgi:hypothetical protein
MYFPHSTVSYREVNYWVGSERTQAHYWELHPNMYLMLSRSKSPQARPGDSRYFHSLFPPTLRPTSRNCIQTGLGYQACLRALSPDHQNHMNSTTHSPTWGGKLCLGPESTETTSSNCIKADVCC